MQSKLTLTRDILKNLISYPVFPGESNLQMIDYISDYLQTHDIKTELVYSEDKTRANLFATIGPETTGGIMLSGHTDVVAVTGQKWTADPFAMIEKDHRLYGRGAVDMKGFLACCLASIPSWKKHNLKRPIQLGFTYDEESGGFGAHRLAQWLCHTEYKPASAIIGEPTSMKIIAGHKGGYEIETCITGVEAHSCNPENGVSAIHYAAKLIDHIFDKGEALKQQVNKGPIFDPPYSSFNIGKINGGSSVNTIAGHCQLNWELRPVPGDDSEKILAEIENYCQQDLAVQMRKKFPMASINTDIKVSVPALTINENSQVINLIQRITGNSDYDVVAFGTDAGYFQNIDIDSVVFGPGSINQAHKPDEYIEIQEIENCLSFLSQLPDFLN